MTLWIVAAIVLALVAGAVAVLAYRSVGMTKHQATLARIKATTQDANLAVEAIAREAERRMIEILLAARSRFDR